ncbi:MAG: type II secretion system F family protein [Armatimonadota bacterium]|nr:type II secretion system F family protein [Armatimonadota bacterium]MDR7560574.1 type II secretion system F family protein [Armatimonadota bacterium]MDR7582689.1 type II secretion system F family protein [Armatimonadota bacterium]MDR7587566.1 type II secretion system F family protein [Armatimonadota bacterium]MDR7610851.1 type II secretion system F family protein [Armatimonadota bacterium]
MARYVYRAWDQAGRLATGVLDADSPRVAAALLQARGYLVTSLQEQDQTPKAAGQIRGGRIGRAQLVLFTRQLATMISAGLPIVTALHVLEDQIGHRRFRDVIAAVRAGIERGGSLSEEIARHPNVFFEFYVNTVRSGEVSGVLDASLNYLADYLEKEYDLVQRVRTAATYPLLVLAFTLLVAAAAVVFIVPVFVQIFASFKVPLPLLTRVLVRTSVLVRTYWWAAGAALALAAAGAGSLRRTRTGREVLDALLLRLPVAGSLIHRLALARFGRAMAVVIRSGIPLLEGLAVVATALGNRVVGRQVEAAREGMRAGLSMAESLRRQPLIPPMVVQMVRVGEETGAMEDVLIKLAEFYEREVDNAVKRFASVVEPILIVCVGGVVAVVALAVLLPIWTLIATLPR